MKQSELNTMLAGALKETVGKYGWKCSRGFVFKATEKLFFSIIVIGQAKQNRLSYSVRCKWLEFDNLFWKIVKLEENSKEPLSFRACGAWTAPQTEIFSGNLIVEEWNADKLRVAANEIILKSESEAKKIADEVKTLDENLMMLEKFHGILKQKHPNAITNIWLEKLLTAILKQEFAESKKIIQDRIQARDLGGFQVGSKTIYSLAEEYLAAF